MNEKFIYHVKCRYDDKIVLSTFYEDKAIDDAKLLCAVFNAPNLYYVTKSLFV